MFKKLMAIIGLFLIIPACGPLESRFEQRVEPHLDHVDIYHPPPVEFSERPVYVQPQNPAPAQLSAVVFPFWINQEVQRKRNIGRSAGEIFWHTWLNKEVFSRLVYKSGIGWPGRSEAREIARKEGTQLYILGQITNYMRGGSQGSSNISIKLNIYSTKNDSLVWSMQQSARMDPRPDMDFVLVKRKNWMPDSPTYVLVKSLSSSLAAPVYRWTHPLPPSKRE